MSISLNSIYKPSPDIVAREIEGELIIVPIVSGIGDLEDELYTLNETARSLWNRLDGKSTLVQIAKELSEEYDAPLDVIEHDVLGLVEELLKRKILVESESPD